MVAFFFLPRFLMPNKFNAEKFKNHKENIVVNVISYDTLTSPLSDKLNILIEVDNKTEFTWKSATFGIEFASSDGELLNIEESINYKLVVHPNEKTTTSNEFTPGQSPEVSVLEQA